MARIVVISDAVEGDTVALYSIDAREWIASDPERYAVVSAADREALSHQPQAGVRKRVDHGTAQEEEAPRPAAPGSREPVRPAAPGSGDDDDED